VAQRVEVQCINKTPRNEPHLRIRNIGGVNSDGTRWKMTEEDAIAGIESGRWEFYVSRGGYTAQVIIALRLGRKYLKTENDGEQPDNLLRLPECP
jgi:hypothetical protein